MEKKYIPIATFNYNKINYVMVLVRKNIKFFKVINNKLSADFDLIELQLLDTVYKAFSIKRENLINAGIKKINKTKFEFFYDQNTKLYIWNKIINNKRCIANAQENEMLNKMYNNMRIEFASDSNIDTNQKNKKIDIPIDDNSKYMEVDTTENIIEEGKEKQKIQRFDRFIKFGNALIKVSVLATVSMFILLNCNIKAKNICENVIGQVENSIDQYSYEYMLDEEENYKNRAYDYSTIEKAISKNKNLQDSEKEFLYKLKFLFDRDYEYMDMETIIGRLKKLKIVYETEPSSNSGVLGTYNIRKNIITIYETDSFENADLGVVTHEICHVFQKQYNNRMIYELSNELLSREILLQLDETGLIEDDSIFYNEWGEKSIYGSGYGKAMKAEYLLATLLTPEQMKQYQYFGDDRIIINALAEIENKENQFDKDSAEYLSYKENALALLENIDNFKSYDEDGNVHFIYDGDKYEEIYKIVNKYYEKLYSKNLDSSLSADAINYIDSNMLDYMDDNRKSYAIDEFLKENSINSKNTDKKDKLFIMSKKKYVLPRTYFSDYHENAIIYWKVIENEKLELTDEAESQFEEIYKECDFFEYYDDLDF